MEAIACTFLSYISFLLLSLSFRQNHGAPQVAIALAGVITFLTELNPVTAAALCPGRVQQGSGGGDGSWDSVCEMR